MKISLTTRALFKHFYIDGNGKSDLSMYKVFLASEQVTRSVNTLTEPTYDIISVHRSILSVTEHTMTLSFQYTGLS